MKKKISIAIVIVIVAAILFVPIRGQVDDGGTTEYRALTYKVVSWKKLIGEANEDGSAARSGRYVRTRFYLIPNNFKSIDELWDEEIADGMDYDYMEWFD